MACGGGTDTEEAGGDGVETIVRKDGRYYYGDVECFDVDDAYRRFRDDYHKELGKRAYQRLGRVGSRKERVKFSGTFYERQPECPIVHTGVVPVWHLGIIAGSYCRMLRGWDIPGGMDDEQLERWLEWAFAQGSGALRLTGRKSGVGRTSKRLNKRYK